MPATLYGTFPILLPGKSVAVSSYGLKKTTGTILFKPGQDGAALALAQNSGQVFPDPQIRATDTGLLEMVFDAYSNTGKSSGVFGTEVLNLSKSFTATITQDIWNAEPVEVKYNWTITEIWLADSYTERKVLAANLGSVFLTAFPQPLSKRKLKTIISGTSPVVGTNTLTITWASYVSSVTRRNFGNFDEVDIVTSLEATIA